MNKKQKTSLFYAVNITVPMIFGFLIYIFSQGETNISLFFEKIFKIQLSFFNTPTTIRNHLCDACWAYSLFFSLHIFLKNKIYACTLSVFWGLTFELLQKFDIINGTFDCIDIIFELIAVFSATSIIHFLLKEKKT